MPRSTSALCLVAFTLAACAQTQQSSSVTAPVTSDAPSTVASAPASATAASSTASASASPAPQEAGAAAAGDDTTPPAQLRGCQADADCVAVDRVGCCHNGWKEAVAVSQKDAYAKSFTCPQAHPICPMFIVQDRRVARCDAASHLCGMVKP